MPKKKAKSTEVPNGSPTSLTCPDCGKSFPRRQNLSHHNLHHCAQARIRRAGPDGKIEEYSCPKKCGLTFASKSVLYNHTRLNCKVVRKELEEKFGRSTRLTCDHCGSTHANDVLLKRHIANNCNAARTEREDENGRKEEYTCPKCKKKFPSHEAVYTHLRNSCPVEREEKALRTGASTRVTCDFCKQTFANSKYLNSHVQNACDKARKKREERSGEKEEFTCVPCGKVFVSRRLLVDHKRVCQPKGNEEGVIGIKNFVTCESCSKIFGDTYHLRLHTVNCKKAREKRESDSGEKEDIRCPKCLKELGSRQTMRKHLRESCPVTRLDREREGKSMSVSCECGKTFAHKKLLQQHSEFCKVAPKANRQEFLCPKCGKKLAAKFSLIRHEKECRVKMRRVFKTKEEDKKYACFRCGKRYVQEESYKGHLKKCKLILRAPFQVSVPCFQCSTILGSASEMRTHFEEHGVINLDHLNFPKINNELIEKSPEQSWYVCAICGDLYGDIEGCRFHVESCLQIQQSEGLHASVTVVETADTFEVTDGEVDFYDAAAKKKRKINCGHLHGFKIKGAFNNQPILKQIRIDIDDPKYQPVVVLTRLSMKELDDWNVKQKKHKLFTRAPFQLNVPCFQCSAVLDSVSEMRTHFKEHGVKNLDHLNAPNVNNELIEKSPEQSWYVCAICGDLYGDIEGCRFHVESCLQIQHSDGVQASIVESET